MLDLGRKEKDFELKGIREFMEALNREADSIADKALSGMIEASIIIRRAMDKQPSRRVPVDQGNLRASWFTATTRGTGESGEEFKGKNKQKLEADHQVAKAAALRAVRSASPRNPTLLMGFSANYAVYVHENLEAKFKRTGAGPRFLEAAMKNNTNQIIEAIKRRAKK
jgi:hypothetical protein